MVGMYGYIALHVEHTNATDASVAKRPAELGAADGRLTPCLVRRRPAMS